MKTEKTPQSGSVTTDPFPNSRKIYVKGSLHNVSVAMREIALTDTRLHGKLGQVEKNAPVTVYDTSGPFTDPNVEIDVKKGLPALRAEWIKARQDVEQLEGISSQYGQQRLSDPSVDALRFAHITKPFRAKPGANVSQLHYAKKGHYHCRNGIHCDPGKPAYPGKFVGTRWQSGLAFSPAPRS